MIDFISHHLRLRAAAGGHSPVSNVEVCPRTSLSAGAWRDHAARLRAAGRVRRAFVRDLDVHQGNGSAGADDAAYLAALARHVWTALDAFEPDIVFYLAGVDIAAGDRYGRFALTDAGIRQRERQVLHALRRRRLPVAITLAGGYASTAERTADLHCIVFEEAAR